MTALLAILVFAALFAVYGLLRPRFGCRGACGACDRPCNLTESNDDVPRP